MEDEEEAVRACLAGCARGDRHALRRLFDQEASRLIGIAVRVVGRRDLAEEVVQEAFVQIWTKAGQFTGEGGSARGWINAIVRNRALNLVRDTRREEPTDDPTLASLQDRDALAEVDGAWSALGDRDRLKACLDGLDEKRRRAILMAHVLGYSHGEIAGRLALPLGTVKAMVRRGLLALRECLS